MPKRAHAHAETTQRGWPMLGVCSNVQRMPAAALLPSAIPAASMSATSSPAIKCSQTTEEPNAPTTKSG
jgi:hypothetical protein